MKETLNDLKTRRAVRSYKPDSITREELDAVLEAGTFAPTAMGSQRACIVAVTNRADRDTLSRLNAAVMGMNGDPFYGAPVVCVVFADGTWPNGVNDGSLIMGNMMNAAHAIGLGSCWIHRAAESLDNEEGRALMKKWGIPEGYVGIGNCILGYVEGELPAAKPRKEGYVIYDD